MAKSLLAAVHNAVAGSVDDGLDEPETGAPALTATKDVKMAKDSQPAGGDPNPGISKAEHDAAVTAARADGKAEGDKAATERLTAALGAEGVKGDSGRMAAALDLAVKSPGMSGADVAAFVVANVAATKAGADGADYAQKRVEAAGLAQPQGAASKKASIDTGGIYAARRKQQEA
jgi:hypothetical protein